MQRHNPLFRWVTGWLLLSILGVGVLGGAGLSARAAPRQASPLDVVINEIAWGGTDASTSDEWIELYNPGGSDVSLVGWTLIAIDGTPSISLSGSIPAGGYYLLERTDDNSVLDLSANLIYTGALSNTVETLELRDSSNNLIDTANQGGAAWFAGTAGPDYYSMERNGVVADGPTAWVSNDGSTRNGLDANSNPLNGTPTNSVIEAVIITEVAWAGTAANTDHEWIELYNPGSSDIVLDGWSIQATDGNPIISIPDPTGGDDFIIVAGNYFLLERNEDAVSDIAADLVYDFGQTLSNSGESLELRDASNQLIDTANSNGGEWPAGDLSTYRTMERIGDLADSDSTWTTNNGVVKNGEDANGNPINGTPKNVNAPTPTPTTPPTNTPVPPTPASSLDIVINEVSWMGTQASTNDEWLELYNPSPVSINLNGWVLSSSDGSPDITLSGTISAGGYFLLERTDDDTIADLTADFIYSGTLSNSGEILSLYDSNATLVDTANINGGAWPAGSSSTYSSMERSLISADGDYVWVTYNAANDSLAESSRATDAGGNIIKGTPGRANSQTNVTPTPTPKASSGGSTSGSTGSATPDPILGISEFLPRPGYDWNNDGQVDVFDEFIEIINAGSIDVNLSSYKVDDEENLGSTPFTLPDLTLKPGERAVFYAAETGVLLSDAGDTVRLLRGSTIVDAYTYGVVRSPDQSWCRIPDRLGYWNTPCFPTPNNPNALTGTFPLPTGPAASYRTPICLLPDTTPYVFIYAECESSGDEIWNRKYWDRADYLSVLKIYEQGKWKTVFE